MKTFIETSIHRIQRTDIDDTDLSRRMVVSSFETPCCLAIVVRFIYTVIFANDICLDLRNAEE